jgi:hypothetical protein
VAELLREERAVRDVVQVRLHGRRGLEHERHGGGRGGGGDEALHGAVEVGGAGALGMASCGMSSTETRSDVENPRQRFSQSAPRTADAIAPPLQRLLAWPDHRINSVGREGDNTVGSESVVVHAWDEGSAWRIAMDR